MLFRSADKTSVKQAVQQIYGIKPVAVNMINVHSKKKRMGKYEGTTSAYKKAVVTLAEGDSIDIFGDSTASK